MKRGRSSLMMPSLKPDAPDPEPEPWECGLLLLKPEYDMLLFLLENGRHRAARLMEQMAELKARKDNARRAGGETMIWDRITIEFTSQEYMALVSILIDHRLRRDSTIEWINVIDDHTVTIDDLLGKLMQAYNRIGNHTPAAPEEKR